MIQLNSYEIVKTVVKYILGKVNITFKKNDCKNPQKQKTDLSDHTILTLLTMSRFCIRKRI